MGVRQRVGGRVRKREGEEKEVLRCVHVKIVYD